MKFHLPTKLFSLLMSAMLPAVTFAATSESEIEIRCTHSPAEVIVADAGTSVSIGSDSPDNIPTSYSVIAKDGEGSATVLGDTTLYHALLVREGDVLIGNGETETNLTIKIDTSGPNNYRTGLSVAGDNACVIIDKASLNFTTSETALSVGGGSGNGSLLVDNGSVVEISSLHLLTIGDQYFVDGSYETPDSDSPYRGTYETSSVDGESMLGKGVVTVQNGSVFRVGNGMGNGYGSFWMGEGEVQVTGAGSTFEVFAKDGGYRTILNEDEGGTSNIIVSSGATANVNTGLFYTNFRENTVANLSVDGSGSSLAIGNETYSNGGVTYLAARDLKNMVTNVSVTNGADISFNSTSTIMGGANGAGEVNMSVDETSSASFIHLTMNDGATVDNAGAASLSSLTVNGGVFSLNGSNATLTSETVTVNSGGTLQATGGDAISVQADSVTVNEGGVVSLKDGSTLSVSGAVTMAEGSIIVIHGDSYASGDVLLSSGGDLDIDGVTVTSADGQINYTIQNGQLVLTAVFDNSIAEALTVSNWGIATASRTFVNAVRGQRTNTGCIANGRGTAWAAVLGGTGDIGCGDIDLKGAAVGADMKVGEKSSVGVAFGYIDGDAKIPGLRKAEQDGTYVALYGEHGLKKLSATSCLSLDWVAAYGNTDTDWNGMDWEQDSLQLNTRLNWNKKLTDRLCMSVFGGLEYFASESDTVENAKTGSIQNLRGEIGVGARYMAWGTPGTVASYDEKGALVTASRPGCEKLVLHGEIRYMNDMVRSNPVIEQDGLRGSGDNPGRQGMGIEAGATYRISERWSASANYGFNTMEDSREHRVNVGASYTF